jgi:DNA-binding HxlR family transcriptional regulator
VTYAAAVTADTPPGDYDRSRCSVGGTLAVVGEKWSLLVLREAFLGVRRFADLQRALGAPRAVLTDRLNSLVASGLLARVPYRAEGERQRHEYRLTEKGRDLYPALVALMQWGDRWLADDGVPPLELTHRDCGEPVSLALRCAAGHDVAGPREVTAVPNARPAETPGTPAG